jgi:hypothetical protein
MTNRLLRIPLPLAALAAALTLAACGGEKEPVKKADSEAIYVEAGGLDYQVQISREINPASVDDRQYLQGVSAADAQLGKDQEWFGVWVRAQNTTDQPHPSATEFKIVDAEGNEYSPIRLPQTNVFAYEPGVVEGKSGNGQPVAPDPDSAAGSGPVQGSLVLFKVPFQIYANSPVEFEIAPPQGGEAATVHLDM